jgi:hypothetical protein
MNATVESNNTPLTAEETALIEAFRAADFNKVVKIVGPGINAEEKRREEAQEAHALDLMAVELVQAVDDVIDDIAFRLATARRENGRWAQEQAANDLLRELAQFLIQGKLDKGDEADFPIAERHHLADPLFAYEWFSVSELGDGTVVSILEE